MLKRFAYVVSICVVLLVADSLITFSRPAEVFDVYRAGAGTDGRSDFTLGRRDASSATSRVIRSFFDSSGCRIRVTRKGATDLKVSARICYKGKFRSGAETRFFTLPDQVCSGEIDLYDGSRRVRVHCKQR
jgi:hypothetical protein